MMSLFPKPNHKHMAGHLAQMLPNSNCVDDNVGGMIAFIVITVPRVVGLFW